MRPGGALDERGGRLVGDGAHPLEAAQRLQGILAQGERVDDLHPDALARADHGLELIGGARGHLASPVHDGDPVAQLLHLLHVVARVDDGGALLVEALDAVEDGAAALGVHGHRGLVEDDEVGAVRDPARDVEAAQQPARELLRFEGRELLQPDEGDSLGDHAPPQAAVAHVQGAEGVDVLGHGELVEDGDLLGHHADAALEAVGGGRHGLAEHADRPLVVGEQLEEAVDRRGLARAVGAEQADDLAPPDPQGQPVHGDQLPVALHQGLDLDGGVRPAVASARGARPAVAPVGGARRVVASARGARRVVVPVGGARRSGSALPVRTRPGSAGRLRVPARLVPLRALGAVLGVHSSPPSSCRCVGPVPPIIPTRRAPRKCGKS